MRKYIVAAAVALAAFVANAAVPVTPASDQAALLKSSNKQLENNKRVVYDFWRVVLEGGHLEMADKYMTESYIQHNPNAATGRQGFIDYFSKMPKRDTTNVDPLHPAPAK